MYSSNMRGSRSESVLKGASRQIQQIQISMLPVGEKHHEETLNYQKPESCGPSKITDITNLIKNRSLHIDTNVSCGGLGLPTLLVCTWSSPRALIFEKKPLEWREDGR